MEWGGRGVDWHSVLTPAFGSEGLRINPLQQLFVLLVQTLEKGLQNGNNKTYLNPWAECIQLFLWKNVPMYNILNQIKIDSEIIGPDVAFSDKERYFSKTGQVK